MLLHDLRRRIGAEKFDALMEQFGREHGGKPTTAAEFESFVLSSSGEKSDQLRPLLDYWLSQKYLPRFVLGKVSSRSFATANGDRYETTVQIGAQMVGGANVPVAVTVETDHGETNKTVKAPTKGAAEIRIETTGAAPRRGG